jgi:hypothetical protein
MSPLSQKSLFTISFPKGASANRISRDTSLDRQLSESEFHKHLSFDIAFVGKYTTFFSKCIVLAYYYFNMLKYKLK